MQDMVRSLERDRKRVVKAYGEDIVFQCLSDKTDYTKLCDIYAQLQTDMGMNNNIDEAKWLKNVIEKTIFSKVMEEHGYTSNGNKINITKFC
ncbi:hypothetical protein [Anaeromicropila herbilytica]|uniref:Uncharacterized protein n=1 Tax=Anaeromicropila herbilytica TaxID=2785025 RepID=A0A7R7IDP1_9FIRM|nr:hypothetical protein [Anaeromicropila herbilytica]BCN31161.1 hypothetical protein bsdtb5_24560 [Anaeromicropila herbilytica]